MYSNKDTICFFRKVRDINVISDTTHEVSYKGYRKHFVEWIFNNNKKSTKFLSSRDTTNSYNSSSYFLRVHTTYDRIFGSNVLHMYVLRHSGMTYIVVKFLKFDSRAVFQNIKK